MEDKEPTDKALGSMSLGDSIIPVENLAESLQVVLDAGARRILLPMASVGDIPTIPGELLTGKAAHRRVVSTQSPPPGKGAARSAHETSCRTLQLFWGERQLPRLGLFGRRDATGLVQVVAPSQPA